MEIIKLDENHLESVSVLFTRNYMKLREKQNILPEKYTNKEVIYELLHDLYTKSIGFVAIDKNNVLGYLIGIPIQNFKGSQKGIYCPEWAHMVISKDKAQVYQKLYDNAARTWVDNGYLNHAISILGYDDETMNIWSWNGFGIHVVDAVRDLNLLSGKINNDIEIRKYKKDDIGEVLDLLLEYKRYMASSPIFLPFLHVETAEDINQWLEDSNNTIWLAIHKEKIISMMEVSYKKSNDAQILADNDTVSIGITYTKEQFRGNGITKALLQSAISEASLNGYKRCAVVFESQNSYGRSFWLKYFKPVCFSLVRKVDDRITWANQMNMNTITPADEIWNKVRNYADSCSWRAGKALAQMMDNHVFQEWERVIVATNGEKICGYCTVAKTDCIPDVEYTPYIGFLFVDEAHRGNRVSQQMICYAMDYLKSVGFDKVYLVSDHVNLYEKYGFEVIDRKMAPWGSEEKIYMQEL